MYLVDVESDAFGVVIVVKTEVLRIRIEQLEEVDEGQLVHNEIVSGLSGMEIGFMVQCCTVRISRLFDFSIM